MNRSLRLLALIFASLVLAAAAIPQTAPVPATSGAAVPKLQYEEPKHLKGTIYAAGSDLTRPLFKFERVATRSGSKLEVVRDFTYPDGKLAARERVRYDGDDLVFFGLEERQVGMQGSATVHRAKGKPGGTVEFTYGPSGATSKKAKVRREDLVADTLSGDMVGPFLSANWEALERGQKVKSRYLAVSRCETVGFTFRKDSEGTWRGQKALIVKMEPTSAIVGALVDPLFFTIEKAPPHRVFQYVGRTTPKIQSGGKWKDLDAVTVFEWE